MRLVLGKFLQIERAENGGRDGGIHVCRQMGRVCVDTCIYIHYTGGEGGREGRKEHNHKQAGSD